MSLSKRTLVFANVILFSLCLAAQTNDEAENVPAPVAVKILRETNEDVPWPKIEINAESAFESEQKFDQLNHQDKVNAVMDYCKETSKNYTNKAKALLQVKIPNEYFSYSCGPIAYRLKTGDYVKKFDHVQKIDAVILNQLDTAYSYLYNQPYYSFWKSGEEYFNGYKSSVFGMAGLPIKYNAMVMQILLLLAIGLSAVAIFKR